MKTNTALTAAALLGLAVLVGAAASEPSRAQEGAPGYGGGEWQAAGSYTTADGGDVWMINTRTGAARNCYWRRAYPSATPELRCAQAQ